MSDTPPNLPATSSPCRVWLGREAERTIRRALAGGRGPRLDVRIVDQSWHRVAGPAVLLMDALDLTGPDRQQLLEAARDALPGRPIVIGPENRELLLEAINTWRAFRVLPRRAPEQALLDAVSAAHDALRLELSVEICAQELLQECRRLAASARELGATQERLLHAERLATVGRTVGTLTGRMHEQASRFQEFKEAGAALANGEDRTLAELFACVVDATSSFDTLLSDMLAVAEHRAQVMELERMPLDALVERSVRLFRHDPASRNHVILSRCNCGAEVSVDRSRTQQSLLNLLRNAVQATRAGDPIEIRTACDGGFAIIEVEDSGAGMTEEVRSRIFSPFFTTKGSEGMGLGLRLCQVAVERQGGAIECASTPGEGTCFRIRLPLAAQESP